MNLRTQPTVKSAVAASIAGGTALALEARNTNATWLLVHSSDGKARGWANTAYLKILPGTKLYSLSISSEEVLPGTAAPTGAGGVVAGTDGTGYDDTKVQAYNIPVPPLPRGLVGSGALTSPIIPNLSPAVRSAMRVVLQNGRKLGNNLHVFSTVGDCHTDHAGFLKQFGTGHYDLGSYASLKSVLDWYSVQPRPDAANSFLLNSQAAHSAYNAGAVLDWQVVLHPELCLPKESPLHCEYRLDKPGIAIISFGAVDVLVMGPEQFNLYMRYIVKDTLDRGIIPVLSTEGENQSDPLKARQFNQIIVGLAKEKNLPLINVEAAYESLPNKGMDPDGIHLTRPADISQTGYLTPDNLKYGYTMRNLVTLQALNVIIKELLIS